MLSIALLLVAHTQTFDKMDRNLSKERFLLFPQRCYSGNTADLLYFMLHRVLSLTFVKIVFCHNAFPLQFRDKLTCANFQLTIWRLTIIRSVFYFSCLEEEVGVNVDRGYLYSVRTWKAGLESDFGESSLQRVRFWNKIFTTRQIVN